MPREKIAQERSDDLRQMTSGGELRVVLRRVEDDGFRTQHILPEVYDLPRRVRTSGTGAGRHVDDGAAKQVRARRLEAVAMRTGERMAAGKPAGCPEPLGTGDDAAFHGTDVRHEGPGLQMRDQRFELGEIG